jgi:hypothetical protein
MLHYRNILVWHICGGPNCSKIPLRIEFQVHEYSHLIRNTVVRDNNNTFIGEGNKKNFDSQHFAP